MYAWLLALPTAMLLLAGCDSVRPIEQVCAQRLDSTRVSVTAAPVTYTTDLTVPGPELTRMGAAGAGRMTLGLTRTSMKSSVAFGSNGITNRASGKHCMRPVINVTLAFSPMTVYVSRDYPEGSCEFAITMQHELRHVAIFRDFLAEATPEVERELLKYFGNGIQYFANAAEAQRKLETETQERISPFVQESMKRVTAVQEALDSRDEYDRLQRSCP